MKREMMILFLITGIIFVSSSVYASFNVGNVSHLIDKEYAS